MENKMLYVYMYQSEDGNQFGTICVSEERHAEMTQATRDKIVESVKELLAMDGTCDLELTDKVKTDLLYDLRNNGETYVWDYSIYCTPTTLV